MRAGESSSWSRDQAWLTPCAVKRDYASRIKRHIPLPAGFSFS